MSLLHCPLCIGLAVLSIARGCALAALVWPLPMRPAPLPQARPRLQPA